MSHLASKRFQQYTQKLKEHASGEQGSQLDDKLVKMINATNELKASYTGIGKSLEDYLQPDASLRSKRNLMGQMGYVEMNSLEKYPMAKFGQSMCEAGKTLGKESHLGYLYAKAGEANLEVARSWAKFEFETERKYISPLAIFVSELKSLKKQLAKLEKERLYYDATLGHAEKAKAKLKSFDPSELRHYQEKALRIQDKIEAGAGNSLQQALCFFEDLEDEQILTLTNLVALEYEYFKKGYETFANLAEIFKFKASEPVISVLGNRRGGANFAYQTPSALPASSSSSYAPTHNDNVSSLSSHVPKKAEALFDFMSSSPDELSFLKGDIINVLHEETGEDGWVYGAANGTAGMVPKNYLSYLDASESLNKLFGTQPENGHANQLSMMTAAMMTTAPLASIQQSHQQQALEKDLYAKKKLQQAEDSGKRQELLLAEKLNSLSSNLHKKTEGGATNETLLDLIRENIAFSRDQIARFSKAVQTAHHEHISDGFQANAAKFQSYADDLLQSTRAVADSAKGIYTNCSKVNKAQESVLQLSLQMQRLSNNAIFTSASTLDASARGRLLTSLGAVFQRIDALLSSLQANIGKAQVQSAIKTDCADLSKRIIRLLDDREYCEQTNQQIVLQRTKDIQQDIASALCDLQDSQRQLDKLRKSSELDLETHAELKEVIDDSFGLITKAIAFLGETKAFQAAILQSQGPAAGSKDQAGFYCAVEAAKDMSSLAQIVKGLCQDLTDCAKRLFASEGSGSTEESLKALDLMKATATSISGSIAQVVVAANVKTAPAENKKALKGKATDLHLGVDSLIASLEDLSMHHESQNLSAQQQRTGASMVGSSSYALAQKAEIEAQSFILAKERELKEAQQQYMLLKKQRYGGASASVAPSDLSSNKSQYGDDQPQSPSLSDRLKRLQGC